MLHNYEIVKVNEDKSFAVLLDRRFILDGTVESENNIRFTLIPIIKNDNQYIPLWFTIYESTIEVPYDADDDEYIAKYVAEYIIKGFSETSEGYTFKYSLYEKEFCFVHLTIVSMDKPPAKIIYYVTDTKNVPVYVSGSIVANYKTMYNHLQYAEKYNRYFEEEETKSN